MKNDSIFFTLAFLFLGLVCVFRTFYVEPENFCIMIFISCLMCSLSVMHGISYIKEVIRDVRLQNKIFHARNKPHFKK